MLRHASFILRWIVLFAVAVGSSTDGCCGDDTKPADSAAKKPESIPTNPPRHKSERTITAALVWLANHQSLDGSWSFQDYTKRCIDKTCTGQCNITADAGATALGLWPFLLAGQTHKSKGPYKEHLARAVRWLLLHQDRDGNLARGTQPMMYSHGLATAALAEAYGRTGDRQVGVAAQKAVDFIVAAQNDADGGWRYNPKDPGDTSVLGWQLSALKSAQLAGLSVPAAVFTRAGKFLDSVSVRNGAEYCYQPGTEACQTMTAVGLLGRQYLSAKRDDPMIVGGEKYLMNHLPNEALPNTYYWYCGTQVMHNIRDADWDAWYRKIRDLLQRSQIRDGTCASGSWDPKDDLWGRHGGRVMMTSLATMTLEVVYKKWFLFTPDSPAKMEKK